MSTGRLLAVGSLVLVAAFGVYSATNGGETERRTDRSAQSDLAATAASAATAVSAESGRTTPSVQDSRAQASSAPGGDESGEVPVEDIPPVLGEAQELVDLDGWLQTEASSLGEIDAPVRIVQFWTFGCYNCKNTLPHLRELYARHHGDGLEIVGVHAPEFDYEKDVESIQAAADELGVSWPIALDTRKTNFRNWQEARRFWPRTYVLDAEGQIRFDHIGEGAYDELADTVAWLLEHQT